MKLVINGEDRDVSLPEQPMLNHVLESLGLAFKGRVIEHNGHIILQEKWPLTPVKDRDCLEIVQFMGGGSITEG